MFINPEMVETKGISEIGSSYASFGTEPFFDVSMIDSDSFFEGDSGIEGVVDASMKISD